MRHHPLKRCNQEGRKPQPMSRYSSKDQSDRAQFTQSDDDGDSGRKCCLYPHIVDQIHVPTPRTTATSLE